MAQERTASSHALLQPSALDAAITTALTRRRHTSTLRRLSLSPPTSVDFSSNDFLSLATSPEFRRKYIAELGRQSLLPLGSGGSRLLDGNTVYAEQLEQTIANFHNAETALLTNSGFDANAAIFSTLPQPRDVVIYDELIHASVHDGMRASRVPAQQRFSFTHNDVSSFSSILEHATRHFPSILAGTSSIFVAVEAVYSMDGDIAPLSLLISTIISAIPPDVLKNVHLVVDEAHATGVLGPGGRGLVSTLDPAPSISTIRLHTFGKALSSNGAAILCPPAIKSYLLNYARSIIYTTFLALPSLALISTAYALMIDGDTAALAAALAANVRRFHAETLALQASLHARAPADMRAVFVVATHAPRSPICSVRTTDPRGLAGACQKAGYVVRPIVAPTVARGAERVRVCLHAGNTEGEIRGLVGVMQRWCEGVVGVDLGDGEEGRERAKL